MRKPTDTLHALLVLARAGLIGPDRLLGSLRMLLEVHRWGPVVTATRLAARSEAALVDESGTLTYRDLALRVEALAKSFWAKGIQRNQVAAVLCRDHRGLVESLLALSRLGVPTILLNPGFAAPQLAGVIRREGVRMLVYDQDFADVLLELDPALPRVLAWHDSCPNGEQTLDALISHAPRMRLRRPAEPARIVLLTSGTTGTPKAAVRRIRSGLAVADHLERIPLRSGETTCVAAPVHHAIGLLHLLMAMALGCTVVLHRRFDARQVLASVQRHSCTGLVLVPTMLQRILDLGVDTLAEYDLSALRVLLCSGSPLPPAVARRALIVFGDVLHNMYGSTEVAVATVATPQDLRAAPGTVGHSPRRCTIRLYDDQDRRIRRAHTVGRVFVGNDLKFTGYTSGGGRPTIDGLVDTGDLGHFDTQGRLFIDGRADDMIVSGGENVFPAEVEHHLLTHYKVRDAVVVGVPDHEFGQRLRAYVVPTPGALVEPEELKNFVRNTLARHKVPRDVVFVPHLPRNATGKVLRTGIADLIAGGS